MINCARCGVQLELAESEDDGVVLWIHCDGAAAYFYCQRSDGIPMTGLMYAEPEFPQEVLV